MAIIKVKTGGITADAITSTEIADNAVVTAAINADAVTDAKIADDVVGTEHLTANEVDTAALGADAVTGAQLADDAVNSEHYTDGSVDTAHIADANVTQGKIADQAINEAKMQISNAPTNGYALTAQSGNTGGLTWAEIGGGITVADQWRVTADFTGAASPISSNLERVDTSGQGTIGSAMTVSSGVFTFPVTGIYKIEFNAQFTINDNTRYYINYIESSRNNGSSWTQISENASFIQQTDSNFTPQSLYTCSLFDCADTSNHKVRFRVLPVNTSTTTYGNTAQNETFFTFIRLGDT